MPSTVATPYDRVFDEENKNWSSKKMYNLTFLKCQEAWLNDRLQARGHVFLNEAYDALGMNRSAAGAIMGWFKRPESKGIELHLEESEDGAAYRISFNVEGVIYNLLDAL